MNKRNKQIKIKTSTISAIAVSGCIYNIGMTAGPWFEGKMAQYLCDIIAGSRTLRDMVILAVCYIAVILLVQGMRYMKRLYVRRFANDLNRDMKRVLYRNLVHRGKAEFETENTGSIMTKAISDVDTCVEGIRKFTTEVFDTGVVMIAYFVMLLVYDWRLTLLSMLFPPIAYVIAERLKKPVSRSASAYKESAGRLNGVTLDRVANAVTYRVYGQEKNQNSAYEKSLTDYEQKAVRANIWETAMQPLYQIISMMGAVMILWFGGKNVLGDGWTTWDIAAFTTFLACFTKLAAKSSKAAKLFNAVQKARVSWKRIKPFMKEIEPEGEQAVPAPGKIKADKLSFAYPGGQNVFEDASFCAEPGEIIGVTGAVACGKSTFGRVFLGEYPYEGSLRFDGEEMSGLSAENGNIVGYMGHQPELISGTIEENILLGESGDVTEYLRAVCMEQEVSEMPEGIQTKIGNGGVRLSGGQQARIALARTLFHKRPVIVLDDPFSAVDSKTEAELMEHVRAAAKDSIVFVLSHRLTLFPQMNQIFWMENGRMLVSDHPQMMEKNRKYAGLYRQQTKGGGADGAEK